jgi:hypothetical protein
MKRFLSWNGDPLRVQVLYLLPAAPHDIQWVQIVYLELDA